MGMKYIKKNLQIVEPEINDEGYYVIGNVAIHPDVFHQQYQPLGFTLSAEEVEVVKHFLFCDKDVLGMSLPTWERDLMITDLEHILARIKQWQDEKTIKN